MQTETKRNMHSHKRCTPLSRTPKLPGTKDAVKLDGWFKQLNGDCAWSKSSPAIGLAGQPNPDSHLTANHHMTQQPGIMKDHDTKKFALKGGLKKCPVVKVFELPKSVKRRTATLSVPMIKAMEMRNEADKFFPGLNLFQNDLLYGLQTDSDPFLRPESGRLMLNSVIDDLEFNTLFFEEI